MLDLSLLAAILLGSISLSGLVINLYVFFKLATQKERISGFQKFCITKAIPNSIVCFTFLFWATPLCAIDPEYAQVPRGLNVMFGQLAGTGAYILAPCLQVCMSFNRFYALYFPMQSLKVSQYPFANIAIAVSVIVAVVNTVIGFPDQCGFVFDPDTFSWRPEEFPCAQWLSDFLFLLILALAITSNSLNFATFLKFVSSRVEGVSAGACVIRRKRGIRMYTQSVAQDTLHLIDMVNCRILFRLNSEIWYQFMFLSVSFLSIHMLDGSVMLYFHPEIHPNWLRRLKHPKSRAGTIVVPAASKVTLYHSS